MPDGTTLNPMTGGDTIDTENLGGRGKIQRIKIATGAIDADGGDVTASNPLYITQTGTTPVSVTLQSAAGATGNGTVLNTTGMASARLTVTGTFVGTITFEGTEDGTTYNTISAPLSGVPTSSATAPGMFDFNVTNLQNIRARISAYTSGSITVTGHTSPSSTFTHAILATGNVGSGATDTGNPIKTGSVYNTSAPTVTNGQRVDDQADANGNKKITLATLIAGEDLTNNKLVVEQRYSYIPPITTAATTTVKSGAGYIDEIICAGGTLGNVTIYDNTTNSGTQIFPTLTPIAGQVLIKHVSFNTGLTIVTAAATAIVGSYR